jgi:hypothetical protein
MAIAMTRWSRCSGVAGVPPQSASAIIRATGLATNGWPWTVHPSSPARAARASQRCGPSARLSRVAPIPDATMGGEPGSGVPCVGWPPRDGHGGLTHMISAMATCRASIPGGRSLVASALSGGIGSIRWSGPLCASYSVPPRSSPRPSVGPVLGSSCRMIGLPASSTHVAGQSARSSGW